MSSYDFFRLSPYDFEELVGDLLAAEWRQPLERFTLGRDQGIDLRCWSTAGASIVVQCKHRPKSSVVALISDLGKNERPKVITMAPERYLIVTSTALTPQNKTQIAKAMLPFVIDQQDVLGADDVEALLRSHPEIEERHFKLWITSTAVLKRVLHNAEKTQTEFEVDRVSASLPLFVQSNAYPRALRILSEQRVVLVSGPPGIGKTTLADLLLYAHLADGYEPVVMHGSVEEGRRLFEKRRKQIFYFDDFLGETFLNDQGRGANQDSSLLKFIEAVQQTEGSRFVLTTREHILRKALTVSERLAQSGLVSLKCTLELSDYTITQRARILYNHIYFGDLPAEYRDQLIRDDFFIEIIRHRNFNPRLISWLSGYSRVKNVEARQYPNFVRKLLESPEAIWRHAFERQLSRSAQDLLVVLLFLISHDLSDVRPSFEAFRDRSAAKYHYQTRPSDLRDALKELEGSFVSISSEGAVGYLNPSIKDFIQQLVAESSELATDIVDGAIFFVQLVGLKRLANEKGTPSLLRAVSNDSTSFVDAMRRSLASPHLRWERTSEGLVGKRLDFSPDSRLNVIVRWAEESRNENLVNLALEAFEALKMSWKSIRPNADDTVGVLKELDDAPWVSRRMGARIRQELVSAVLDNIDLCQFWEWDAVLGYSEKLSEDERELVTVALDEYRTSSVFDEIAAYVSTSDLSDMRDTLESLAEDYNLDFGEAVASIDSALVERERPDDYEGGHFSGGRGGEQGGAVGATDDDLRDLFGTLA